jgi:sialate O-acetylesterase
MVVTLDVGENHDIHPSNKHDVGNRFALLALNRTYNKDFIDSGPELDNIEQEGKYLNVYFKPFRAIFIGYINTSVSVSF